MKVLVDTSVWADFFNGHPSPEATVLARLIEDEEDIVTCGLVLAEFFQGIRHRKTIPKLERLFREMACLRPREPDTYLDAASLYRDLRARGITVRSTVDCVIVRLAAENDALILAKDRDIRLVVESGLSGARALVSDPEATG